MHERYIAFPACLSSGMNYIIRVTRQVQAKPLSLYLEYYTLLTDIITADFVEHY